MRTRVCTAILSIVFCCAGGPVFSTTIPDAKLLADGQPVSLSQEVVTYASADFFYIQTVSRSTGIRVEKIGHGLSRGFKANIVGTMRTNGHGERFIQASTAIANGSETVEPIFLISRDLGGANWFYAPATGSGQRGVTGGVGTNNIGLQVRAQGHVMQGAPDDNEPMFIDDGNGCYVEVVLPPGVVSPGYGARIAATGVLSCAKQRQQITGPRNPAYTDFYRPVILANEIQVIQAALEWRYSGEMVKVGAGSFLMGGSGVGLDLYCEQFCQWFGDELPQHTVYIPNYSIGKYEVTRGEYKQFMAAGGYQNQSYWSTEGWAWKLKINRERPDKWDPDQNWGTPPGPFTQTDKHPVVGTHYYEAEAFCKWAGGRLPTEAEWEKAARWDGTPRIFPWGNEWHWNYCNDWGDPIYQGYQTAPVGSYPKGVSPYGCHDMAGNVWEMVTGWHRWYGFTEVPPKGWIAPQGFTTPDTNTIWPDPLCPIRHNSRNSRLTCGGSWHYGDVDARCASKWWTQYDIDVGFRMAR